MFLQDSASPQSTLFHRDIWCKLDEEIYIFLIRNSYTTNLVSWLSVGFRDMQESWMKQTNLYYCILTFLWIQITHHCFCSFVLFPMSDYFLSFQDSSAKNAYSIIVYWFGRLQCLFKRGCHLNQPGQGYLSHHVVGHWTFWPRTENVWNTLSVFKISLRNASKLKKSLTSNRGFFHYIFWITNTHFLLWSQLKAVKWQSFLWISKIAWS